MADRQQWGNALQGLGAWWGGRGPQYEEVKRREAEDEQARRRQAMIDDTMVMASLVESGNRGDLLRFVNDRRDAIIGLGGSTDHTDRIMRGLMSSNPQEVQAAEMDILRARDVLAPQKQAFNPQIKDGQLIQPDGMGGAVASPITGFEESPGAARDRELRGREVALKEDAAERAKTKLSAGAEKAIMAAQDAYNTSIRGASQATQIADYFESLERSDGGVATSFSEGMKKFFGNQDDYTEWRRYFNQLRLSQGLQNLPPGPATDKDMIEAFKGVPPENAPASQIASFARGVAKMARLDAAYNFFREDYISDKGNPRNLLSEWRKNYKVEYKDEEGKSATKDVSTAEIYLAAVNRNMTPEEVMQALGIAE